MLKGFFVMTLPAVLLSFIPTDYLAQLTDGVKVVLLFVAVGIATLGFALVWRAIDSAFYKVCEDRVKGKLHSKYDTFDGQAKAWRDMWDGN